MVRRSWLQAILFVLLCATTSAGLTYTVAYRNLAQTFIVQHTFQPSAPGTPFYVGANGAEVEVADLHAEVMTRLSANPTNCTSGQIAQGIDGSGNAEGCANVEIDVGNGLMRYPGKAQTCRVLDDGNGAPSLNWGTCGGTTGGTTTNVAPTDTEGAATNYTISTLNNLYGWSASTRHIRTGQLLILETKTGMEQSSGVNRQVMIGFTDINPESSWYASNNPVGNIAFFRWDSATESAWACGTGDGTTTTSATTGISVDANIHTFKIELDAAKTYAKFYIDGTLVCNRTSNIPGSAANANMTFFVRGRNEAGGGAAGLRISDIYMSAGVSS